MEPLPQAVEAHRHGAQSDPGKTGPQPESVGDSPVGGEGEQHEKRRQQARVQAPCGRYRRRDSQKIYQGKQAAQPQAGTVQILPEPQRTGPRPGVAAAQQHRSQGNGAQYQRSHGGKERQKRQRQNDPDLRPQQETPPQDPVQTQRRIGTAGQAGQRLPGPARQIRLLHRARLSAQPPE